MYISPEKKSVLALLFSQDATNVQLALTLAESQHIWIESYLEVVNSLFSMKTIKNESIIEKLSNLKEYNYLYSTNRKLVGFTDVYNYLPHLLQLSMANNLLSDMPDYFANYTLLEELNLSNNLFETFPLVLTQIPKLQSLFLNHNKITEIPAEIAKMPHIEKIFLGNNRITTLPAEMQHLHKLKKISLADNPLDFSKIPSVLLDETKSPKALVVELLRLKRY